MVQNPILAPMKSTLVLTICALISWAHALFLPHIVNQTESLGHGLLDCEVSYGTGLSAAQCRAAIEDLPRDRPDSGAEHVFSPARWDPLYRLPVFQQHGRCLLTFTLNQGCKTDVSSWTRIRDEIQELWTSCVVKENGIGGFTLSGDTSCIRAAIFSTDILPLDSSRTNDSTVAAILEETPGQGTQVS